MNDISKLLETKWLKSGQVMKDISKLLDTKWLKSGQVET